MELDAHQSAIAHELGKVVVGAVLDLFLEDTQRHGLLNHIIVIGDVALVDAALERLRRVISTIQSQQRVDLEQCQLAAGTARETGCDGRLTLRRDTDRWP